MNDHKEKRSRAANFSYEFVASISSSLVDNFWLYLLRELTPSTATSSCYSNYFLRISLMFNLIKLSNKIKNNIAIWGQQYNCFVSFPNFRKKQKLNVLNVNQVTSYSSFSAYPVRMLAIIVALSWGMSKELKRVKSLSYVLQSGCSSSSRSPWSFQGFISLG